jgi:hypothetical protein
VRLVSLRDDYGYHHHHHHHFDYIFTQSIHLSNFCPHCGLSFRSIYCLIRLHLNSVTPKPVHASVTQNSIMITDANCQDSNQWKIAVVCFSSTFPHARYNYNNALDYIKQYTLSNILSFFLQDSLPFPLRQLQYTLLYVQCPLSTYSCLLLEVHQLPIWFVETLIYILKCTFTLNQILQ